MKRFGVLFLGRISKINDIRRKKFILNSGNDDKPSELTDVINNRKHEKC